MATVRIEIEPWESVAEVEEALAKAIGLKQKLNPKESFSDPAMTDLAKSVFKTQEKIYKQMWAEVDAVLKEKS